MSVDSLCEPLFCSPDCNAQNTVSHQGSPSSKICPKKKNETTKGTVRLPERNIVLLALIPLSISCVMDLPVMSAHSDLLRADRFLMLSLAAGSELSGGKCSPLTTRVLVKPVARLEVVKLYFWLKLNCLIPCCTSKIHFKLVNSVEIVIPHYPSMTLLMNSSQSQNSTNLSIRGNKIGCKFNNIINTFVESSILVKA